MISVIPKPERAPVPEPKNPVEPRQPFIPQVRTFSAEQQARLKAALTAAEQWRPGAGAPQPPLQEQPAPDSTEMETP